MIAAPRCNELVARAGVIGFCRAPASHLIVFGWACPSFRAFACGACAPRFSGIAIALDRSPRALASLS